MNASLESKHVIVDEIKNKIKSAKSVVFADYKGITVGEATKIRANFRNNNAEYKVYKNRLILRALDELGIKGADAHLEGTTSVAFGYEDEVVPARLIADALKETQKMSIKFGIFNGEVVNGSYVKSISSLPSKNVLIAQLLSVLNGPVSGLARALNAIAEK
ncbi:MAG: 50S ribosomal protein L10 [Spirochaetales bacterium]